MRILGKGNKGDFFGKINNTVCFLSLLDGQKVKYDEVVDVKITHTTPKCLFAELVVFKDGE